MKTLHTLQIKSSSYVLEHSLETPCMCRVYEFTLYVYKFVWTNRYLGSDRCTKDTSKRVVLQSRTYKYGWFDIIRNSTQQKNYLKDILQVTFTRPSVQVNVNVPEHFTHVLKIYSGGS